MLLSFGARVSRLRVITSFCPFKQASVLTSSNQTCTVHRRSNSHLTASSSPWFRTIAESTPVKFIEENLVRFHDETGLPWWLTIVVATFALRATATIPLAVYSEHILARLANLEPEALKLNKELRLEVAVAKKRLNLTENQAQQLYRVNLKRHVQKLIERENCHPMKTRLVILFQIPLWISLSFSLRNISAQSLDGSFNLLPLQSEGFSWVSNLALADPLLLLPIGSAVFNLVNIELYNLRSTTPKSTLIKIVQNGARVLSVLVIPIGLYTPSAVTLYWMSSSFSAFLQNVLLMSPSFRRAVRIPINPREVDKPYSTVWTNFKNKLPVNKTEN